jgi:hypothetical protein
MSSFDDSSNNVAAGKAATPVQLRVLTGKDLAIQERFYNPKQFPTAKNRANKSTQRVDSQILYYYVFTYFAH